MEPVPDGDAGTATRAGRQTLRYAELADWLIRQPPRLGPVRLVAIDGPAGSGKTTFAGRLVPALAATGATVRLVHTDDLLEGWDDALTFWPRLRGWLLDPLAEGSSGAYRLYDWRAARFHHDWITVPVPEVLVIEGVSTARREVRHRLSLAVFLVAGGDERLARGVLRDGEELRPQWLRWMAAEREHFAADRTGADADLLVDGTVDGSAAFTVLADRRLQRPVQGGSSVRVPVASPVPDVVPAYDHPMASNLTEEQLAVAVARELPGVRADLERLVRIPGIAFDGFDHSVLERSAEAVADLLRGAGLPEVRVVRSGGQPAVIGRRPAPPGAPTVLLYAHHDVQPVGDPQQWRSDPFEPQERAGRLYGRGAADDKAGILAHVAALRVLADDLPVGVVVFVEGEEEYGSESLQRLLAEYRDDIASDVIVIADSGNWEIGVPALTTNLRGIVNAFVEVRTLDHAVHSGMYGGPVPDALMVLCRLLATLHDDAGDVAVPGLVQGHCAPLDLPVQRLRAEAGMLDGVELIGTGRAVERLWSKPSLSILGIDAPRTGEAPNALVPVARAKVSLRIAPGDSGSKAYEALSAHLESHAPWGARVCVTLEHQGDPCVISTAGPAFDAARYAFATAWDGVEPVEMGVGGSIPFIATFQEMFPEASIVVVGPEDPDSRAHGPNESLHLGEFARLCLAETLLLARLGTVGVSSAAEAAPR
jgi:acetylornithine deacetylase/succinyl-diaminopimelate desuccinylase-like protein/uridine kinase